MKNACFLLFFFVSLSLSSQSDVSFTICGWKNPVPFDSLKKCPHLKSNSKGFIQKFQVVSNSIQGMSVYDMGGDSFDESLLTHLAKGKPKELHLTITIEENGTLKVFKDIPILLSFKQ